MPARYSTRAATTCVAACLLFAADSACAHSAARGAGDFYAGALHALTALEHVLPFLALGILAGQQGRKAEPVLLVFCVALAAGATAALWVPPSPYTNLLNIVSAVLFGGLVAASWSLPMTVHYSLAVVFGLSHGFANGAGMIEQTKPYLYIPGVALAGLAVTAYGLMVTDYLLHRKPGWMHIAVRVAGSWITAIGILVLATSGAAILKA
jgi:urease accessory protein